MVSSITTACRALASASGPCWAASWFAQVDLGLEARLLEYFRVADRGGDERRGLLLLPHGLPIGDRPRDARVLLDLGLVRHGQVLDVVAGAGD